MQKPWPTSKEINHCKKLMQKNGKLLLFATKFFPLKIRQALYVLYAFYKTPDNIVDNIYVNKPDLAFNELNKWETSWEDAHKTGNSSNPILNATIKIHKNFHIPIKYSRSFLKSMKQDINKNYYKSKEELQSYIYGSSSVIGIMLVHIIGEKNRKVPDRKIIESAQILANAFQLTSFMKNISEDITLRNRIYIPEAELEKFGLSHKLIKQKRYTKSWLTFLHNQINNCQSLYTEGLKGLPFLNKNGRFPILLASNLHRHYLKQIIKSDYKVYHNQYKISLFTTLRIFLKTLLSQ